MARVTTEDCLDNVSNRYLLCNFATRRARQLILGASPTLESSNKALVTALREVASGRIELNADVESIQKASLVRAKYPDMFTDDDAS